MRPACKAEARWLYWRNDGRRIHAPVAGIGRWYKRMITRARRRFFATTDRREATHA